MADRNRRGSLGRPAVRPPVQATPLTEAIDRIGATRTPGHGVLGLPWARGVRRTSEHASRIVTCTATGDVRRADLTTLHPTLGPRHLGGSLRVRGRELEPEKPFTW